MKYLEVQVAISDIYFKRRHIIVETYNLIEGPSYLRLIPKVSMCGVFGRRGMICVQLGPMAKF